MFSNNLLSISGIIGIIIAAAWFFTRLYFTNLQKFWDDKFNSIETQMKSGMQEIKDELKKIAERTNLSAIDNSRNTSDIINMKSEISELRRQLRDASSKIELLQQTVAKLETALM